MNNSKYSFEQIKIAGYLLYWTALIIPLSIIVGSAVALFLWIMEITAAIRWAHLWLIFFLPLAGVLISVIYKKYGKNIDTGNNLILDEIHKPGGGIPARMAPLIMISTVITHLFGGSAGREGTAVQMGGSIASLFSGLYKLKPEDRRVLLMCGMAAGFGAVFGTPVTGAIFALEVLAVGRIKYDALIPCFIASLFADCMCRAYGIHHTSYKITIINNYLQWFSFKTFNFILLFKVIVAGIAFGLVGFLFTQLSHFIKKISNRYIYNKSLIAITGGSAVICISFLLGSFDYLGLGITNPTGGVSIGSAFTSGGAAYLSWFWKLLLTAITISTGFKGGEVTPLFFIGATLGNLLASLTGAPVDLFAGLGFIAVFAGAANTPLACTIMGVELFGSENILYYAVACFTAYYFSGHSGIYTSQKSAVLKFPGTNYKEQTIKE